MKKRMTIVPSSESNSQKEILPTSAALVEKAVGFDHVEIRYYDQTIGDSPSTSNGPPISLDWKYNEEDKIRIDDYEFGRPRRRNSEELRLSEHLRRGVLMYDYGFRSEDLNKAAQPAKRITFRRRIANCVSPVRRIGKSLDAGRRKIGH